MPRFLIFSLTSVDRDWGNRKQLFNRPNVVSQARSHCWGARQPLLWQGIGQWQAQAFVRMYQQCSGFMEEDFFRGCPCFSGLARIESAAGQVAALDVSGVFAQKCKHFCLGAIDCAQFCAWKMTRFVALLDHLQIEPICSRFLASGWLPTTTLLWDDTIESNHRIIKFRANPPK